MDMKDPANHPARSADFLSRLHDGDLDAAERARFESHRARCAECRRAAAEFEAALSLFRSSRTSPPPADLSARILRRLQASTPERSRQRFGIVHGINLKWAAGFAVAVIAAIVGLSVVVEREAIRKAIARETPIPIRLQKGEKPAAPATKPVDAASQSVPPAEGLKAPAQVERRDAFAPNAPEAPQTSKDASGTAIAVEKKRNPAASREEKEFSTDMAESGRMMQRDAAPLGFARNAERPGGEGAAAPSIASSEIAAPARLVILPLDGGGNPPEILTPDASEALSSLRGRQYLLLVEAAGRVREAKLEAPASPASRSRAKSAVEGAAAPPPVLGLRFKPGDRPRRLLLRVE
jgi:hypothetical protein